MRNGPIGQYLVEKNLITEEQLQQVLAKQKESKGKLFVIDNADILLDDRIRRYIALDENNQYIIIGRNPTELLLNMDEIKELEKELKGSLSEIFGE